MFLELRVDVEVMKAADLQCLPSYYLMVEGAHQDTRPHTHQNPFQLAQIYPSKVERKESIDLLQFPEIHDLCGTKNPKRQTCDL